MKTKIISEHFAELGARGTGASKRRPPEVMAIIQAKGLAARQAKAAMRKKDEISRLKARIAQLEVENLELKQRTP